MTSVKLAGLCCVHRVSAETHAWSLPRPVHGYHTPLTRRHGSLNTVPCQATLTGRRRRSRLRLVHAIRRPPSRCRRRLHLRVRWRMMRNSRRCAIVVVIRKRDRLGRGRSYHSTHTGRRRVGRCQARPATLVMQHPGTDKIHRL
jgi:hypothetical protein